MPLQPKVSTMNGPFLTQPIEKWQHEISKASKQGLLSAIDSLTWGRCYNREHLMKLAETAKRDGRHIDLMASYNRDQADPKAAGERWWKRKLAAKKAARTRKRNKKARAA